MKRRFLLYLMSLGGLPHWPSAFATAPDLRPLPYSLRRVLAGLEWTSDLHRYPGIWNQDRDPAWDSKYTTNIHLRMDCFGQSRWPVCRIALSCWRAWCVS